MINGIPHYAPSPTTSQTGYDPARFEHIARHAEGHFWFEPRSRLLVGLAQRFFPDARRYLEIGCGTGAVLAAMAAARDWTRLAGADIHAAALAHARRRCGERTELVQLDARFVPARSAFDLVGAFDIFEHIPQDTVAISEIHGALIPGGGLLAAVPQHPVLWSRTDEAARHVRRYRRGELEGKLREAGFEVLYSTSYMTTLLPLLLASRFLGFGRAARASGGTELDVNRILNTGLRRVLDLEVGLSLRGLSWPVGGSKVVVARKIDRAAKAVGA